MGLCFSRDLVSINEREDFPFFAKEHISATLGEGFFPQGTLPKFRYNLCNAYGGSSPSVKQRLCNHVPKRDPRSIYFFCSPGQKKGSLQHLGKHF
jgi:hypothetical protein